MLVTFCNDYVFCKLHSTRMLKRKDNEPMLVTACVHLIFLLSYIKWQGGNEIFQALSVFVRDYVSMPIFAM